MIDQFIVNKNLCLECGMCEVICPNKNIKLKREDLIYIPKVGKNCNKCQKCVEHCPAFRVNFKQIMDKFLEGNYNKDLGKFLNCYYSYSKNENIRINSSSGGIITTLCLYLLENKIIDGAIVVKADDKITNKVFIAKTKDELLQSMQSKYIPTPVCLSLKNIDKTKKYVFVGSPCHIHGIRKAMLKDKQLNKNIIFTIGHFCEYNPDPHYVEFIANKFKIDFSKIKQVKYREGHWPGNLTFIDKKNKKHIPLKKLFYPVTIPFIRNRCMYCIDLTAELADISVGDAWSNGFSGDKGGNAYTITRNKQAEKLIKDAKNYIHFEKVNHKNVIQSQKTTLLLKKEGYHLRKKTAKHIPYYYDFENNFKNKSSEVKTLNKSIEFAITLRKKNILKFIPKSAFNFYLNKIYNKIPIVKEYEK